MKKDILILDKASMVGGTIMLNLMKTLNLSSEIKHFIIVGDDAQLPQIEIDQEVTELQWYSESKINKGLSSEFKIRNFNSIYLD